MKTLYNADGKAKTMDFVDAREHIAMGGWFETPPETESPTADTLAPPADDKGAVPGGSDSAPCLDEIQGETGTRPDNAEASTQIDGQGLEPCRSNADFTKAELLEKLAAITDLAKPAMSKSELLDMLNELEAVQ